MIFTEQVKYFYPNTMGRIILLSLEEIIGQKNMQAVLIQAGLDDLFQAYPPDNLDRDFSFESLSKILNALEIIYGANGGRGLAQRVGRATFKHGLHKFCPLLGSNDLGFRLNSINGRLQAGANIFAEVFNRFSDQVVKVESDNGSVFWHIERCPFCWNRYSENHICHLASGLLQESLYWASGGRIFKVEETKCIAKGDSTCTFQIEKLPLN